MPFRVLRTEMWSDKEVRRASNYEKMVFLYAITAPNSNQAGFYRLPFDYIILDLKERGQTEEEAERIFTNVLKSDSKLFKYDFKTEQMFIPNFLKYNVSKMANQFKGLASCISTVELCPLLVEWLFSANRYCSSEVVNYLDEPVKKYTKAKALEIINSEEPVEIKTKAVVVYELLGGNEDD